VLSDNSYCTAGSLVGNGPGAPASIGPILDFGNLRPLAFELQDAVALHKYAATDIPFYADFRDALYSFVQRATESDASGARFNQQQYQDALAGYAIINDWQVSHDARAPWAIKRLADRMWADYDQTNHRYMNIEGPDPSPWCASNTSYWFANGDFVANCGNVYSIGTPPIGWQALGMHLVHVFWWYYAYTGDTTYRDHGDEIFNHIFDNMDLASGYPPSGKTDSEIYYTSFNGVGWRTGTLTVNQWYGDATTSIAGSGQPSCDLNADGYVNVLDVQLATNQTLGYAACGSADLNGDGKCTIVDVQRIISASLGAACYLGQ
jgi:hypothetical protein